MGGRITPRFHSISGPQEATNGRVRFKTRIQFNPQAIDARPDRGQQQQQQQERWPASDDADKLTRISGGSAAPCEWANKFAFLHSQSTHQLRLARIWPGFVRRPRRPRLAQPPDERRVREARAELRNKLGASGRARKG